MQIKVCGMQSGENIAALMSLKPDMIGFIFFEDSPRFLRYDPAIQTLIKEMTGIQKAGVFVNAGQAAIESALDIYQLDFVQLHGEETPSQCKNLSKKTRVIKAFPMDSSFHFDGLNAYENCCEYFLFDSKKGQKGGSGGKFNWRLLEKYPSEIPFFLSGGITGEDAQEIKRLSSLTNLAGIDLNSGFELSPGLKNIPLLKTFFNEIRN